MGRRYSRSRSSSVIRDVLDILANSSWYMSLVWGLVFFTLFYYLIPDWLQANIDSNSGNKFFPAIEITIGRRIHWVKWIGVVAGLISIYFAARNYFVHNKPGRDEKSLVTLISKLLGRRID